MDILDEDVPSPRTRVTSEAVFATAKTLNIEGSCRDSVMTSIGIELSTWKAFFGSLQVLLHMDPSKNPLEVLDKVKKLIDEKERISIELQSLKSRVK